MGLKSASSVFCRFLDHMLGELKYQDIISYLDDGAIASATFEQHIASLERVLKRLDDAGITLGARKTYMAKPETEVRIPEEF